MGRMGCLPKGEGQGAGGRGQQRRASCLPLAVAPLKTLSPADQPAIVFMLCCLATAMSGRREKGEGRKRRVTRRLRAPRSAYFGRRGTAVKGLPTDLLLTTSRAMVCRHAVWRDKLSGNVLACDDVPLEMDDWQKQAGR